MSVMFKVRCSVFLVEDMLFTVKQNQEKSDDAHIKKDGTSTFVLLENDQIPPNFRSNMNYPSITSLDLNIILKFHVNIQRTPPLCCVHMANSPF